MQSVKGSIPRLQLRGVQLAAIALVCVIPDARCPSQTIELTQSLTPPRVPQPSFASSVVATLEQEAEDLQSAARTESDSAARAAGIARADLRLVAAELLASGDRGGIHASAAFVAGLKLAGGRELLDTIIGEAVEPAREPALQEAAVAILAAFDRGYADYLQRAGAAQEEDARDRESLSRLLARLIPLTQQAQDHTLQSHWIVARAASPAASAPADQDAFAALRHRLDGLELNDATRQNLVSILDFLERGQQFPELSPRVEEYRTVLESLIASAETIAAATWATQEMRDELAAQLAQAAEWFHDPSRRELGVDAAAQLDAARRVLSAASALANENVEARPLRAAIRSAQSASQRAATASEARRPFAQLAIVLERMLTYRQLESSGLMKELRQAERELAKTYRESEQKMLKALSHDDALGHSAADPQFMSLLEDHRQRLEDLQRVRQLPAWSAAIARIHPPATKDFEAQTRRWSQALLEPSKRAATILTMDRFEEELARFDPLPFEQSLRENAPTAIELTGGLAEQVLAVAVEKRRAWADQWSRPEVLVEASNVMITLHTLLQSMRDAAALAEIDPDILNRWPAWQLDPEIVARGQSDVVTRLRLACAALAKGDLAVVKDQTDRLERDAPLARLAGRLMHALGNELGERPAGAEGILAQQVIAPTPDALLLEWRDDVSRLCHHAAEAEAARASAQADAAREIDDYVHALATRLLEQTVSE